MRAWEELHPEALKYTTGERDKAEDIIEKREEYIGKNKLEDVLEEYGIDISKLEKDGKGLYHIKIKSHFTKDKLPEGYGYKGGAARSLLLRNLGIDKNSMPRDLDIIRVAEKENYPGADDEISREYMPEDFETDHGVEKILDLNEYFNTRDFTINEVMVYEGEVIASKQCLLDTARRIIRITKHERKTYSKKTKGGPELGSKTLAKMIRFYAEGINRGDEYAMQDIKDFDYEENFITPFYLAIHLDRAYETSQGAAEKYIEVLKEYEQIPDDIEGVEEAAQYLSGLFYRKNFYYRYAPIKQFRLEENKLAEEEKQEDKDESRYYKYQGMPKIQGMSRRKKQIKY